MQIDARTQATVGSGSRLAGLLQVSRAWRREANAEHVPGVWLGRLPEGWFAFHDVPLGERGAIVDHVVIGPGGVFTIDTKDLTGAIRVNARSVVHDGRRTTFLAKASARALRAASLLSAAIDRPVEVRGLLAILADEWIVKRLPDDVYVGGPGSVKHWMLQQPPVLRPSDVIVLVAAASKPRTWTAGPERSQVAS
ncbi:MAG: nuclease-related domain-containing protein [Actinomycetota bacterium]